MKKLLSRNQLKRLSKQVNCNPVAIDELEDFCEVNKSLNSKELQAEIWSHFGMFPRARSSQVVTFFTTKGGVLKTTLAYNFARVAALSGVKTLVVGLDMQCDMTNCISGFDDSDHENLQTALEKLEVKKGLFKFFNKQASLEEIIHTTDLDNLNYIPESPDLTLLNDSISLINRREFWLKEKVIAPLRASYDLIIFDCSPNWNRLITNALCASDLLVSPVECKINNFKNIEVFNELIEHAKQDLFLEFSTMFVPTRFSKNKKLSREILEWYKDNIDGCTKAQVRESIESEEAIALQKSVIEYQPLSKISSDILSVIKEFCLEMNEIENRKKYIAVDSVNVKNYQMLNNQGSSYHGVVS